MIEIRDLRFAYGEGGFELHVERLSVRDCQRVCWIGPSGCGKTTLLHLVAGINSPAAGQVETCGQDLTALRDAARRDFRIANVGLVFQDFALLDYLSLLENILLPFRINRSLRLESEVRDRADNSRPMWGSATWFHGGQTSYRKVSVNASQSAAPGGESETAAC